MNHDDRYDEDPAEQLRRAQARHDADRADTARYETLGTEDTQKIPDRPPEAPAALGDRRGRGRGPGGGHRRPRARRGRVGDRRRWSGGPGPARRRGHPD